MATKKKVQVTTKKKVQITTKIQIPPREVLHEATQSYVDRLEPKEVLVFEIEALIWNPCSSDDDAVSRVIEAIEMYLEKHGFNDPSYGHEELFVEQFKVSLLSRKDAEVE